jgi:hypothetical protein
VLISHLAVSGLIVWLVYGFAGLAVLRQSWINVGLIWCCSLLATGTVLRFVPMEGGINQEE